MEEHKTTTAPPLTDLCAASDRLSFLTEAGLRDEAISRSDARALLQSSPDESSQIPLLLLLHAAGRIRRRFFGDEVQVHVLNNVQSGACPEDCGYCGQAKTSDAPIQPYRLKSKEEIIAEAESAKDAGAFRYCMVLSGRGPSDADIDHMAQCIREVRERFGLRTCLSSGLLDEAKARRLKDAGLDRLNHNLNTSRRWYPSICSTHTYDDRAQTLRAARAAGLGVCSGVIIGMGETVDDVLDVAFALREIRAESIPVNFLVPIPGNTVSDPVCDGRPLTPEFCLRVMCAMRFINPGAEIRIAAGREGHLRSMQALSMEPANSLFVDGYLLTKGAAAVETLQMIRDAGFRVKLEGAGWPEAVQRFAQDPKAGDGAFKLDAPDDNAHPVIRGDKLSERKLAQLRIHGSEARV